MCLIVYLLRVTLLYLMIVSCVLSASDHRRNKESVAVGLAGVEEVKASDKRPKVDSANRLEQRQNVAAGNNTGHSAVTSASKQSRGQQQRQSLKLSEHPDCMDDVRKYCSKRSSRNFAVVECLQDNVGVSHSHSSISRLVLLVYPVPVPALE